MDMRIAYHACIKTDCCLCRNRVLHDGDAEQLRLLLNRQESVASLEVASREFLSFLWWVVDSIEFMNGAMSCLNEWVE